MKKGAWITIFLMFGVLLLLASYIVILRHSQKINEVDSDASATLQVQNDTPYTDMNGNPFSFDVFRGNIRVVTTWASWCPFCRTQLLELEKIAEEYGDKKVVVIAINRKEPRERATAFLKTIGEFNKINFVIDLTDAYYTSVGGFSMPETVFYNQEGAIFFHKRGEMTFDDIRQYIEEGLASH